MDTLATSATLATPVCLAVEELYDDSMGAYNLYHMWDGEKVFTEGGMYADQSQFNYVANANPEQMLAASNHLRATTEQSLNYCKYSNQYTYVGCVVKLARSRKAPNGVPLKVVDYDCGGYNERYNRNDPARIAVEVNGSRVWVSEGTVKELVKGIQHLPYWVITEEQYTEMVERIQEEITTTPDVEELPEVATVELLRELPEDAQAGFDKRNELLMDHLKGAVQDFDPEHIDHSFQWSEERSAYNSLFVYRYGDGTIAIVVCGRLRETSTLYDVYKEGKPWLTAAVTDCGHTNFKYVGS